MTAQSGIVGTADGAGELRPLSQAAIAYAASRGISLATLEKMGAASGTAFFPRRLKRKSEALFFPYQIDGEVVNWKAAAFPEKDFIGRKGGTLCMLNLDAIVTAETVFITEGETDAASLMEAGIPLGQVTSVPNGARDRPGEKEDGDEDDDRPRGYGFVEDALKRGMNRAERFVWCGDNDPAGLRLRQDMVKILGAARFWYVPWPEGIKDANEYLQAYGPDQLQEIVTKGAVPWPVEGLYTMSELPEPAPLTLWDPGFPEWEGKVRLAPSTMCVVTGHPGHGKTSLMMQIWFQIARRYGIRVCVASFETKAKPFHRRTLRQLFIGHLEIDMSDEEKRRADQWIERHFIWVQHPARRPNLEWLLDMAEVAVVRHGCSAIVIDPWNRVEASRPPHETETDYIGRCLRTLYNFGQDMNCHVMVLAHPAKMDSARKGKAPELEDIAGSKNWDNMVDQGFVVHRRKVFDQGQRCTEATFYQRKSRIEELGYACKLDMDFDLKSGRYKSIDYKMSYE